MMEVEQIPADLSAEDKRKYLFLKQINTLNVDVSANKVYDHSWHIGMSADGISQRAVDGYIRSHHRSSIPSIGQDTEHDLPCLHHLR